MRVVQTIGVPDEGTAVEADAVVVALKSRTMLVAGSGVALGLPQNHGLAPSAAAAALPTVPGASAIVSGSCSAASNAQVVDFIRRGGEAFAVEPLRIAAGENVATAALAWAEGRLSAQPLLFYATAAPEAVKAAQALQVARLRIGPQIDPGVPWCHALSPVAGAQGLLLALKSGNFGTPDFFTKAFDRLA
jgi:uncharacterized protein YgbK (DUF1537 family)